MGSQKSSIEASIIIDAPIKNVWKVLTDFESLKDWSSSFVGLSGDFGPDGKIEVSFKSPMRGIQKMKKQLFHFEEGKSFGWTGVFILGMKDYHRYSLEAITATKTKFTQTDSISGGASYLLKNAFEKQMKKSYDAFNKDLKNRIEKQRL